jgi:hypothetical protein
VTGKFSRTFYISCEIKVKKKTPFPIKRITVLCRQKWFKNINAYGNGDIFFFSSSGSRHSENLKRILDTLEGRWLHTIFPNSPKILKVFQSATGILWIVRTRFCRLRSVIWFFLNPEFHKFTKLLRWMKTRKGLIFLCYKNELGHKQLLLIVFGQDLKKKSYYKSRKWRYFFFFSSNESRHSENLKKNTRYIGGEVAAQNFSKFPKILWLKNKCEF